MSHYPAQLSGGEQQRVALARALGPAALAADRRRADRQSRRGDRARRSSSCCSPCPRERGATLALVTHDPALAARCDRTMRMRSGARRDRRRWRRHERALRRRASRVRRRSCASPLRDLRGGLAGLRIFLACIALGVAAIVGVNSLARALDDGLARDGRAILGGDASLLADPPRTCARGARRFWRRAASSRPSPTCARWRATRTATRRWSRSRRSTPPGRALGAADLRPADARRPRRSRRDGRRVRRRGRRRRCSTGSASRSAIGFDLGEATSRSARGSSAEPDRLGAGIGFGAARADFARTALRATRAGPAGLAGALDDAGAAERRRRAAERGRGRSLPRGGAEAPFREAGWEARDRANVSPELFARTSTASPSS